MKMSSMSMDVPTLKINGKDLQNLISFIYKYELLLKEFGAIKIQLDSDCKLALKKKRKNLILSPADEQIVKINNNEGIYSVQKIDNIDESTEKNPLVKDQCSFWSSLFCSNNEKRKLNISILSNKSFFSTKTARIYFDIHRLPKQSLLKLGGKKLTDRFVPYIKRSHGPGAIFPLSCAEHNLFSIDYHHEGGIHHWYIIPSHQRDNLQRIINQQDIFICLDHGKLFIDPSVLDKNHIRYHRIIQHPNEFVVLSAGTLAQSFTENASWSESIAFTLPSWIEEGLANLSRSLCQCDIHQNYVTETIDITLFRHELIQKYITTDLNIIPYNKSLFFKGSLLSLKEDAFSMFFTFLEDNDMSIDMGIISTLSNIETNSSKAETQVSTNTKLIIPLEPIVTTFQSAPTSLITQSISSYFSEEDKNNDDDIHVQMQYQILEEGTFHDAFNCKTSNAIWIDSISNEHLSEPETQTSQLYQTTNSSIDIHQNITNNYNVENYLHSCEELMDLLSSAADNAISTYGQVHGNVDTSVTSKLPFNTYTLIGNKRSYVKKKQLLNQTIYDCKTLFVSGLRSQVNKNHIRRHFKDCIKVTIKQCRATSHLKYAFVLHQTPQEAECNFRRPIDYYLLGSECCIEYAIDRSTPFSNHQSFDNKALIVRKIPENVSEHDLYRLFVDCHITKYYPARIIYQSATTTETENKNKILLGYAVIRYDNEQQAISVSKHTNQYQINGQSLNVSLYRKSNSLYATTRELFVD